MWLDLFPSGLESCVNQRVTDRRVIRNYVRSLLFQ